MTLAPLLAYNANMEMTVLQTVRRRFNPAALRAAFDLRHAETGLTQQQLAAASPFHYITIHGALNGSRRVSGEVVSWLCRELGVPESAVYEGLV